MHVQLHAIIMHICGNDSVTHLAIEKLQLGFTEGLQMHLALVQPAVYRVMVSGHGTRLTQMVCPYGLRMDASPIGDGSITSHAEQSYMSVQVSPLPDNYV